jgi:hypothetical protein
VATFAIFEDLMNILFDKIGLVMVLFFYSLKKVYCLSVLSIFVT